MNDFLSFAAAHGLLIDHLQEGRWCRVKTEDKPKKRNGAYKFLGTVGFVQNHATMAAPATWHPDREFTPSDRKAYAEQMALSRAKERREREAGYATARAEALALIGACQAGPHPYLTRKGFPAAQGLVHPSGDLIVPMRDCDDYATVNSAQRIREDGFKLFLSGGKAKGSVFVIGRGARGERWLVEGYATGLSLHAALADLRRPAEVIVCFSAGNLLHVAEKVRRPAFVMADNDPPDKTGRRAGQETATATGLPWVMPPEVGTDANDLHASSGLRRLVRLIVSGE